MMAYRRNIRFVCLVFIAVSHVKLYAAGENTLKLDEALANKKFREDNRITDIELKAQAGSLSRYSLKFDLSYSGPPVGNLSDPEMPNPDNRPRINRTSLSGFMGGRYRVNSNEAWNVSTGLRWYSPYHQLAGEDVRKKPGEKDYEVANPQLSYDRTYAAGEVQMRSSAKGSVTTQEFYQDRGQFGSAGFSQNFKYSVLQSRLTLGLAADADIYFFNREFRSSDGRMSSYGVSFIPSLEYRLLDNLNLRTSLAYSFASLRMNGNWWEWDSNLISQRVGLGWGITRDIYFNPFLSFFTNSPAWRTTSLSFSTVFSIF